jgi:hypothetical protein
MLQGVMSCCAMLRYLERKGVLPRVVGVSNGCWR